MPSFPLYSTCSMSFQLEFYGYWHRASLDVSLSLLERIPNLDATGVLPPSSPNRPIPHYFAGTTYRQTRLAPSNTVH